ncbi:MAG: tRNA (cytidine(34)-2'-O)-methyltransferase [Magnetococcales bacterium]|nr:tRNA (cytidine(34)-2'-O)-methyltransferase [Magnetococcales bacterium]
MHIVLYQPEIPHNSGNIMRLCAATRAQLHLIGPLGFRLDSAAVRRAGMDYRDWATVRRYDNWSAFLADLPPASGGLERLFAFSTHGSIGYHQTDYQAGDLLLFGSEGSGLPEPLRRQFNDRLRRIPMAAPARSLNLANSVAIVLYEALRQLGFPQLSP